MSFKRLFVAAAVSLNLICSTVSATQVSLAPGTWNIVDEDFGGTGNFFITSWLTLASGTLRVTDLYVVGDAFQVYRNGVLSLTTPLVPFTNTFIADPAVAWLTADYSKGSLIVAANDVISIKAIATPVGYTDNTVAVYLVPVPEPSTYALMALGVLVIVSSTRRSRSA